MTLWAIYYRLRDARQGIARNAWASCATVLLLTLTLVMFGGFLWINANLVQVSELLERQVQIRVFPQDTVRADELTMRLRTLSEIASIDLVRGSVVVDKLSQVFGREIVRHALPPDAFSDSLSIRLVHPEQSAVFIGRLKSIAGVGDVIWGQGFADSLLQIAVGLQRAGTALVAVFFVAALLTGLTTMHLAILSREVEIQIQRWVGVGPWGIRMQFLIEAMLLGLLASVIADSVLLYVGDALQQRITALMPFAAKELHSPTMVMGIVLTVGPILGLLGGAIASHRLIGTGDR
jgi:cell division transport system permease protein